MKKIIAVILSMPLLALAGEISNQGVINEFNTELPVGTQHIGSVNVDNFPSSQTVGGTVTSNQGTAGASEWLMKTSSASSSVQASQLGTWTVQSSSPTAGVASYQGGAWTVTTNVNTTITQSLASVSVSSSVNTQIFAANANRKLVHFCNDGNKKIYFGNSGDDLTSAGVGSPLYPGSCYFSNGSNVFVGAMYARSISAPIPAIKVREEE